jgi:hypothetical protein
LKQNSSGAPYGIYCNSERHVTFGGGHDIGLFTDCNTQANSYSNLGHSYDAPEGTVYDSESAHNYLAGAYYFITEEIEIFNIIVKE